MAKNLSTLSFIGTFATLATCIILYAINASGLSPIDPEKIYTLLTISVMFMTADIAISINEKIDSE